MKPCDIEEVLAKANEAAARTRRLKEKLHAASGREPSRVSEA